MASVLSEEGAYSSGAPVKWNLLALLSKRWKWVTVANTLAYSNQSCVLKLLDKPFLKMICEFMTLANTLAYCIEVVWFKKCFIVEASEERGENLFQLDWNGLRELLFIPLPRNAEWREGRKSSYCSPPCNNLPPLKLCINKILHL